LESLRGSQIIYKYVDMNIQDTNDYDKVEQLIKTNGPMSVIPYNDREYLLKEVQTLSSGSKILEVGTFVAGTTSYIAKTRPDCDVYSVDINQWDLENDGLISHIKMRYDLNIVTDDVIKQIQQINIKECPNVKLLTGTSLSLDIDDLDFVYLDGDHGYKAVLSELHYYWNRCKEGAVIMGDDVNTIDVYDALRMFCLEKNIEYFIYSKTFKIKKVSKNIDTYNLDNIITQFGPLNRERLLAI
jgi:predicted O-methyltransferase YrrM